VDSVLLIWTGAPIVTLDPTNPATFTIPNGGSAGTWNFTVADKYGHPMAPGTQILVSGAGLLVDGTANVTMLDRGPDQFTYIVPTGQGITNFSVTISDADPATAAAAPVKSVLTLTIIHPVYGTYKSVLATGTVD
jgi:hypothetical protein